MRRLVAAVAAALTVAATATPAVAAGTVTTDTGPALSVPQGTLDKALDCTAGDAGKTPVLLVPGTTVEPDEDFGWNYVQAFLLEKRPFCTVTLPNRSMADIQVSAEYVVNGIRAMHRRFGGRIDIVGHSQGGMIGRWALKYWPDTRGLVDDLVGMAPSNHGTADAELLCQPDCAPAIWQQRRGSAFLKALNDGPETWPGVSYTVIWSNTDLVLVPPEGAKLTTGQGQIANILLSDACPDRTTDHVSLGTYDPVTYALVEDALNHPGPVSIDRFDHAACTQLTQPGVNQEFAAVHFARAISAIGATLLLTYHVPAEPPLAPYARVG
jgi:triacylglycerol esterase/lipase EstA (alpha/beta hydrolase family)